MKKRPDSDRIVFQAYSISVKIKATTNNFPKTIITLYIIMLNFF